MYENASVYWYYAATIDYNHDMTFDSLGLSQAVLDALSRKGFEEPTPIQNLTIPRLMQPGPALVARARTGTGKTAAFGIPLVEKLGTASDHIRALILVPTRELALQVTGEIASLKSADRPRILPVYGGASMGEQLRRIGAGVDVVVGTPGRVLDHIERGSLRLEAIEFFILDEADEMLDMGFIEDIETIMGRCNPEARTVLFSATMPRPILDIVSRRFGNFETVEDSSETVTTELAEQLWLELRQQDRLEALCRIMDIEESFFGIVFTATRVESEEVAKALAARGYDAEALHGDLSQEQRERILAKFRERRLSVLVATDVASRGIDIESLSHVINWSLPHDPDSYLHRVGRTGRAGNTGTAITFVTPDEYRKLFRFRRAAGSPLRKASVPAVKEVLAARRQRVKASIFARAESLAFLAPTEAPVPDVEQTADDASISSIIKSEAAQAEGSEAAVQAQPAAEGGKAGSASLREPEAKAGSPEAASDEAPFEVKARTRPAQAKAWLGFAQEILERMDPREALATVLIEAYGAELDPAKYKDIADVSVDSTAIARLFVGAGRRDRLTPRDLATMIRKVSGVPDRLIGSIEILDTFSFVSVPFEAAEQIIAAAKRAGGMPFVKLAVPRGERASGDHAERSERPGRREKSYSPAAPRRERPTSPPAFHADEAGRHHLSDFLPKEERSSAPRDTSTPSRPDTDDRPPKPRFRAGAAGSGTEKREESRGPWKPRRADGESKRGQAGKGGYIPGSPKKRGNRD